jgi:hypothetical protein
VRLILLFLTFATAAFPQTQADPVTAERRLEWFGSSTIGASSLIGGLVSSGLGTAFNRPPEYGPQWEGFAKRYGMRLTGVATSNAVEASVGALWGEDPRYPRLGSGSFGRRMGQVFKMTVLSRYKDGHIGPAYATYTAFTGSNFLSNTWRADSEADASHAGVRIGLGFAVRMTGNAFAEFWPDIRRGLFRQSSTDD